MTTSVPSWPVAPRRRPLAGRSRKVWLTAHIGFSVGWLGAAYCMLVLGTVGLLAGDLPLRIAAYQLMHLFDEAVNIPLGLSMLATGLVVSLRTRWGLVRHRWVLTKFVAGTLTLILAPLLSVPRVEAAVAGLRAGTGLGTLPVEIVSVSVAVVTTLTAMTAVSVFKPWGPTRWAARGRGVEDHRPPWRKRRRP
jgi:dipeptide/tripeptide permease